jgi:hypothetical protein
MVAIDTATTPTSSPLGGADRGLAAHLADQKGKRHRY